MEILMWKTWIIENEIEKKLGLTIKDKTYIFIFKKSYV